MEKLKTHGSKIINSASSLKNIFRITVKASHKWIIFLLGIFLSGCFISMPSSGPVEARDYVGKAVVLNREILVVNYFTKPISWKVDDEENIGPKQKVLKRLDAGTILKIKSIRSFRMPYGMDYSFRCEIEGTGFVFDLGFHMVDSIDIKEEPDEEG